MHGAHPHKKFTWSFLLAPVAFPILGADFLCNFRLMVDVSNKLLVAGDSRLTQLVPAKQASSAVVTGVMAAPPPLAVFPTPSVSDPDSLESESGFT